MKLTETQAEIAGQLVATWVFQQMRNREMAERRWGKFIMSNGMPVTLVATYHRPDHLRPRFLAAPGSN